MLPGLFTSRFGTGPATAPGSVRAREEWLVECVLADMESAVYSIKVNLIIRGDVITNLHESWFLLV